MESIFHGAEREARAAQILLENPKRLDKLTAERRSARGGSGKRPNLTTRRRGTGGVERYSRLSGVATGPVPADQFFIQSPLDYFGEDESSGIVRLRRARARSFSHVPFQRSGRRS
jgi:hypothetical protein